MSMRVSLLIDGNATGAKAAVQQTEADLGRLGKAAQDAQGKLNQLKPPAPAVQDFGKAVKLSSQDLNNMQFQLQDIAVGLASGQSPFTVMMQQGSQLSQIFKSGTGVMGALRAVGGGIVSFITNPLNVAVLAFGLVSTAAVALFDVIRGSSGNDVLARQEELVKKIGDAWDGNLTRLKAYAAESRATMLFQAQALTGDLEKATRSALSDLVVSGSKNTGGFRLAGVGQSQIMATGNDELKQVVQTFFDAVKSGKGDVLAFRDQIALIGSTGADAATRAVVRAMLDQTQAAAEQQQELARNRDLVKGLSGDQSSLNKAMEKSSGAIGTLTDKLNGLSSGAAFAAQQRTPGGMGYVGDPSELAKQRAAWSGQGSAMGLSAAPEQYRAWIIEAALKAKIEPDLLARLIYQESRFNPNAVSPAGAKGLTQLMPGTASDLGVRDPFNANASIDGGARYLGEMLKLFAGNVELALMAYNWGQGNVQKWQKNGADPRAVPDETRNYVSNIMQGSSSLGKLDRSLETEELRKQKEELREREGVTRRINAENTRWADILKNVSAEEEARSQAIGKSVGEQARLTKEQQLWAQARGTFGDRLDQDKRLHDQVAAAIRGEAAAYGVLAQAKMEDARFAQAREVMARQDIDNLDQIRATGGDILRNTFAQAEATGTLKGAWNGALDSIQSKLLDLLESGLNDMLFGAKGSGNKGVLGGLLQGAGSLLGSLFGGTPSIYGKGGVFAAGLGATAFAQGAAFTNTIVDQPTYFRFGGNQLGVMGEAGEEAIMPLTGAGQVRAMTAQGQKSMPLTRMGDGSLGVDMRGQDMRGLKPFALGGTFGASSTGSTGGNGEPKINFNVHNYSGEKTEVRKSKGQNGEFNIDVLVGQATNRHIAQGGADAALMGRFAGMSRKAEANG